MKRSDIKQNYLNIGIYLNNIKGDIFNTRSSINELLSTIEDEIDKKLTFIEKLVNEIEKIED